MYQGTVKTPGSWLLQVIGGRKGANERDFCMDDYFMGSTMYDRGKCIILMNASSMSSTTQWVVSLSLRSSITPRLVITLLSILSIVNDKE